MEPGYIRPRLRASLPFTLDHGIFSRIDIGVKIRQRDEKKKKEKKSDRQISWMHDVTDFEIELLCVLRIKSIMRNIYIFDEKVNSDVILIYQYRENVLYVYVWNSREYIYIGILHVSNL